MSVDAEAPPDDSTSRRAQHEKPATSASQHDARSESQDRGTTMTKTSETMTESERESCKHDNEHGNEKEAPPLDPSADYPDGGLRAWLVVLGGFCVTFATWGSINNYGNEQDLLARDLLRGESEARLSLIGSLQLGLTFMCAIFAGRLFDAGYMRSILIFGTVVYMAGFFGVASATKYWQFILAQGFANGLGCGTLFLPAGGCIGHHFRKKRSLAFGIITTGSSCGGVLYAAVFSALVDRGVSFAWTMRILAFITLGLIAVAHVTLKTRLPIRPRAKWVSWEYFRDPAFNLLNISSFLVLFGLYMPYYYLPTYASQNGVSPTVSQYAISILNAGSLFGRLIPNYFADRYGPYTILTPHCFIAGILVFCWQRAASNDAGTIVFAILYGWASGAFVSISPACLASLIPPARANEIGIALSMFYCICGAAVLAGNPIAGAIIARQGGRVYDGAVAFSGGCIFAGSLGLVWNRWLVSKRKGTHWV